ncbi:MAG: hypothetical protein WBM83_12315 [Flavobacteriaceae bacterium]
MKKAIFLFIGLLLLQGNLLFGVEVNERDEILLQGYDSAKTAITITYPTNSTVWEAPGMVRMEWTTKNIPANKTIKFYLSKDDMVIQELGIFKNTGFTENVQLTQGIKTSSNYRIVGIELFPDDKYSIAKYATELFTINQKPREPKIVTTQEIPPPPAKNTFDGRALNYVKELEVKSSNIIIKIWDHSRKDGDIVSIYLNGEAIISKYTLEYRKKKIEVTLDPSKPNDLFLYAHNLGKFPPNTVSIEIVDGTLTENIILNSDLKSCEAVSINVKK